MADNLNPAARSALMARIRAKNTQPELVLRKNLHHLGLRFRLHVHGIPGTPDLIFPRFKAAVFVHGCFWHRHAGCKCTTTPKTNTEYWLAKFEQNVARDDQVKEALRALGWRVFVVWECELRTVNMAAKISGDLATKLRDMD